MHALSTKENVNKEQSIRTKGPYEKVRVKAKVLISKRKRVKCKNPTSMVENTSSFFSSESLLRESEKRRRDCVTPGWKKDWMLKKKKERLLSTRRRNAQSRVDFSLQSDEWNNNRNGGLPRVYLMPPREEELRPRRASSPSSITRHRIPPLAARVNLTM